MGLGQRPARRPRVAGVAVSVAIHATALAVWAAWPVPPAPPPPPRASLEVRIHRSDGLRQPAPGAAKAPAAPVPPARPRLAPSVAAPPKAVEPLRNPAAAPGGLLEPTGAAEEAVLDQVAEGSAGEGVVGGVAEAVATATATGAAAGEGAAAPPDSPWAREQMTEIRRRVLARLTYPRMARTMGWEGVVVVAFLIVPGGQATGIAVARSSGHDALDRAALEAVAASVPLPSPPSPQAILLPVRFRQER
jgi:periplasmic protein TonB